MRARVIPRLRSEAVTCTDVLISSDIQIDYSFNVTRYHARLVTSLNFERGTLAVEFSENDFSS